VGDEGGDLAVLGLDINLAVDHGRLLLFDSACPLTLNRIASKPEHDKAMRRLGS
jgi:hypothetical protein